MAAGRLSSCGSRVQLLRGMWNLPRPGLEPVSPALAGRLNHCTTREAWLIYFLTRSLYLLIPFTHSTHSPPTYLHSFSPLATTSLFSVSKSLGFVLFCLFCVLESMCKWSHAVFVFLCLTYLAQYSQAPSMLWHMAIFLSFLWLNGILVCIFFIFIHQWTLKLFPYVGYCE